MDSEALTTGRNIITDMSNSKAKIRDILRRNVSKSAHKVINNLSGRDENVRRLNPLKVQERIKHREVIIRRGRI